MSPLPMPPAERPMTLLLSFAASEAEAYAASKHLAKGSWKWVESAATLDEQQFVHVEFVGMHWRKRSDLAEVIEVFERKRLAGETR